MEHKSTPPRGRAALSLIAITCAATLIVMGALLLASATEAAGPTGQGPQYILLPLVLDNPLNPIGPTETPESSRTPRSTRTNTPTATSTPANNPAPSRTPSPTPTSGSGSGAVYKVIGWNDLGMHCLNRNFENLAVLPPFNTLYAEVIKQGTKPQLITTGVTVEYSIEGNTYSAGKTNFWDYAQKLFGLAAPLSKDTGLTGSTLAGAMQPQAGGYFKIEGVPMVPFSDANPTVEQPYQIAHLTLKDSVTGKVLAETRPVAPASTEMHCETCHSDGQRQGIATGNVETNILTLHDVKEGTSLMNARPVLCASCHSSNALGTAGQAGVKNLSLAMHNLHQSAFPKPNTMENTCYSCHPGQQTQCLRDVMYSEANITCTECHGDLTALANPARNPWVDEPKCGSCHEARFAEEPGKLYRNSKGHGGLFCETCHGSPHAILPSSQPADNIQNIALQGHAGTLKECKVCHGPNVPSGREPHE
jgi:hypothetical protein